MKLSAITKISVMSIVLLTSSTGFADDKIRKGAKYPGPIKVIPTICTKGGSASVIIKSVEVGEAYFANILLNGKEVSAYCAVGDCALLYNYGITNVSAKVQLDYTYMEEYESTKTCKITDIELTPNQAM